jgi:TfoX/Sxy family transcriptional regulator of competence genes
MAVNEKLTARIREIMAQTEHDVEEKKMFTGICFMVNGKMCVCAGDDRIMVRLGPEVYEAALEEQGCLPVVMKGKPTKGYVYVYEAAVNTAKKLNYWVQKALSYNKQAKAAVKKKKKAAVKKRP